MTQHCHLWNIIVLNLTRLKASLQAIILECLQYFSEPLALDL